MLTEEESIYAKSLEQYCDDPLPSYFEFLNKTWISFKEFGLNFNRYPIDYSFPRAMIEALKMEDILLVVSMAITFTIFRIFMTSFLINPLSKWMKVEPADSSKFNESACKVIIYTGLWTYCRHVIIVSGRYSVFDYPLRVWQGITYTNEILKVNIPNDIYWLYIFQLGFYLHSVYATLRLDTWRSDSNMLILHHILTLCLLEFSFIMRYHLVGALVLYLHDIADIVLEFVKLNVYLKSRKDCNNFISRIIANLGYFVFVSVWFVFRLYWYPLKVLHMTNWGVYITQLGKEPKMYLFFNIMLVLLLFLNLYWFNICLKLGYKILTGQMSELEDMREVELPNQKSSLEPHIKKNGITNGECISRHDKTE